MEKIVVSCLESRIEENQSVYSRFLLGPFLSGHAVTVATALRRALLSEVKTIAITALHIQGVTHEFSTVVGIRESVLELSLNFQQIILSTQTRTRNVQVGYLHVQGPAIVHANDLKLPDGIECVNPTQYIATLSTEGLLVVKFLIGEKKSFLKSNTSTLNSKKIKEAKAYSAQLSKSLLSHAEYDPPRLFRLLRNQSLPNGAITRRAIEEANLLPELRDPFTRKGLRASRLGSLGNLRRGSLEQYKDSLGPDRTPFDKSKVSSAAFGDSQNEQNLVDQSLTKGGLLTGEAPSGPPQTAERSSVGRERPRTDLEVARLTDQSRDMTTVGADSNLDQSANRIADEFNSEVCLRTIIPLDPIFTPVYQVNFGIERDDLSNQIRERVIMEVWTNGSIHPRQAINEAALSTMSIFSKLRKTFQLDSHSLALSANSTAPAAGFTRVSRLHKTKSIVKGEQLNDDASESLGPLALSALGLMDAGVTRRRPSTRERLARVAQGESVNFRRFALAKPSRTKLDLTNPVRPKLNSFSSLGFVRSRHPVALFLQNFGKSHIRGQTFILEQSFWLKAKFFKGHGPVLKKTKYTSEAHTFKRTFLPSFKVVLGPFARKRHVVPSSLTRPKPEQNRAGLTKAQLLFRLRFCLAGAVLQGSPLGCEATKRSCFATPLVGPFLGRPLLAQPSVEHGQPKANSLVRSREATSRLPLAIKDLRSSSNSRFARVGKREYADGNPKSKSRPAVAGLRSKPSDLGSADGSLLGRPLRGQPQEAEHPTVRFARPSEARQYAQQPKPKPILFLIKYRTFSFTTNALRIFGCKQENSSFLLPLTKQLIQFKMGRVINSCLPLMSKRSEPSLRFRFNETQAITAVEGSDPFDVKQVLLSLARSALGLQSNPSGQVLMDKANERSKGLRLPKACSCSASGGWPLRGLPKSKPSTEPSSVGLRSKPTTPGRLSSHWPKKSLEPIAPKKRFASSIALRAIAPLGKLWLRSNLKKQFGFFQFAYNGVRAGRRHGSSISHTFFTDRAFLLTRLRRPNKNEAGSVPATQARRGFVQASSTVGVVEFAKSAKVRSTLLSGPRLRLTRQPKRPVRPGPAGRSELLFSFADHRPFGPRPWEERSWPEVRDAFLLRGLERLGVCVTRTAPLMDSKFAKQTNRPSVGLICPPLVGPFLGRPLLAQPKVEHGQPKANLCSAKLSNKLSSPKLFPTGRANRDGVAVRSTKLSWADTFNLTTFPLMMTKVPPLCLPSGLVTLFSSPSQGVLGPKGPTELRSADGKIFGDFVTQGVVLARRAQQQHFGGFATQGYRSPAPSVSKFCTGFASQSILVASRTLALANKSKAGRLGYLGRNYVPVGDFVTPRPLLREAPSGPTLGQTERSSGNLRCDFVKPARLANDQVRRSWLEGSEPAAGAARRYSSATDLFGFNSDSSALSESLFQLTTQERLSILYSSNLDKMSFLSSDLANLSLSLKTYTFLKKKGKKNIASLLEYSPNTLFSLLNGDEKMFSEIERCLLFLGLPFKERS